MASSVYDKVLSLGRWKIVIKYLYFFRFQSKTFEIPDSDSDEGEGVTEKPSGSSIGIVEESDDEENIATSSSSKCNTDASECSGSSQHFQDRIKCSGKKELSLPSSNYGNPGRVVSDNSLSQSGIMSSTPTGTSKSSLNSWRKPTSSTSSGDNTDEDESPIPVSRSRHPSVVDTESEVSPEVRSPDKFVSWRPSPANKLARTRHDPKQLNYSALDVSAEGDSHPFIKRKNKRNPQILDSDEDEADDHSMKKENQTGNDDSLLVSSPEVGTSFSPKVQNVSEDSVVEASPEVCKIRKPRGKNKLWVIDSDEDDESDGCSEKKIDIESDDSVIKSSPQVSKSFPPQTQNVSENSVVSSPEICKTLSPQEKYGHKFRIKKKTDTRRDTSGQPQGFDTSSGSMASVNQSCSLLEVSGSSAGNTSGRSLTSALSFTDMTAQEIQEKLRQKQVSVVIFCSFQLSD